MAKVTFELVQIVANLFIDEWKQMPPQQNLITIYEAIQDKIKNLGEIIKVDKRNVA